MPISLFRKEIHQLIGKSEVSEVFTYIKEHLNSESSIYRDLLLAQSTFSLHEKEYFKGKISFPELAQASTKTIDTILDLCTKLQKEDLIARFLLELEAIKHADTLNFVLNEKMNESHKVSINTPLNVISEDITASKAKTLNPVDKLEISITKLRKSIESKPENFKSKTELASLLRQGNQHGEAIEILKSVLEKKPDDEHSRNELALCYRETDKLDWAIDTLNHGLKLVEKNNHFHTNLFVIHLFFTCDCQQAVSVKNRYAELTGGAIIQKDSVRNLYDSFIEHFELIHNGNAHHELIGHYLGECFHTKKAYKTAATLLSKLLQSNPESFWYKNARQKLPPQYDSFFL